ncbi:hypothetical protein [Streptomyces sp. NBC_01012]|uniref:hypothetical protein n=1 Tax=Streptomyces sp. NBC_01012 TaxID=2903717 RepID=UPI00386B81B2|nr:hypothetical protein OG623_34615 [Streptomyces sp. NBC_01012]
MASGAGQGADQLVVGRLGQPLRGRGGPLPGGPPRPDPQVASTTIGTSRLAFPELLVEVKLAARV